jgi:hypothetical protein
VKNTIPVRMVASEVHGLVGVCTAYIPHPATLRNAGPLSCQAEAGGHKGRSTYRLIKRAAEPQTVQHTQVQTVLLCDVTPCSLVETLMTFRKMLPVTTMRA